MTPAVVSILVLGVLLAIIIALLITYYSVSANAGLVLAVEKIESTGEKMTFKTAIKEGKKYFWRMIGAGLLLVLWVFAFFLVIGALVLFGVLFHNLLLTMILVILGVIFFVCFLALSFYLGLLYLFVSRIIVLENTRLMVALQRAHILVKGNWHEVIVSWLMLCAVSFGVSMAMWPVLLVVLAFLGLPGYGFFVVGGKIPAMVYAGGAGIAVFTALFIIRGLVTAYFSVYMTLIYRAFRYIDSQKKLTINNQNNGQ
jgi:hypothetical protein